MARRSVPIEEKIESQKEVVSKAKDRYENELDKLEKLVQKRDELRSKELMEAFARSERSFEEVMRFLSGNEVDDEDRRKFFSDSLFFLKTADIALSRHRNALSNLPAGLRLL